MHQRKLTFTELSDGFLTLPGGTGTMDELWEAVSWAQLGYHAKPVGLLNVAGFYDGLLAHPAMREQVDPNRTPQQGAARRMNRILLTRPTEPGRD